MINTNPANALNQLGITLDQLLDAAQETFDGVHPSVESALAAIKASNILPNFEDFRLPLLQPLVHTSVINAVPIMHSEATLISEYVTSRETVVTLPVIEHLKSCVPKETVDHLTKSYPFLNIIYDPAPALEQQVMPGTVFIKLTDERKLMAWLNLYYRREQDLSKCADFFHRIQGMEMIERISPSSEHNGCDTYVFGHFDWYDQNTWKHLLFTLTPDSTIRFLLSKGFSIATQARPGQAVVYHTENDALHFAKVEQVEGDEITVVSKFGQWDVFRHLLECVPANWGDRVTFLNFPSEVSRS